MTPRAPCAIAIAWLPVLAGCAQLQKAVNFIDDPKTQQAIFSIETVGKALICDINQGSAFAASIEKAASAHTGITTEIAVTSGAVCTRLQGKLTGKTVGNTPAVRAVNAGP